MKASSVLTGAFGPSLPLSIGLGAFAGLTHGWLLIIDAAFMGPQPDRALTIAMGGAARLEIGNDLVGKSKILHQYFTGASIGSMSARLASSQCGSFNSRPSDPSASSAVKPGAVVATSNSTPPGSRK